MLYNNNLKNYAVCLSFVIMCKYYKRKIFIFTPCELSYRAWLLIGINLELNSHRIFNKHLLLLLVETKVFS